jgi:hypothetical protein
MNLYILLASIIIIIVGALLFVRYVNNSQREGFASFTPSQSNESKYIPIPLLVSNNRTANKSDLLSDKAYIDIKNPLIQGEGAKKFEKDSDGNVIGGGVVSNGSTGTKDIYARTNAYKTTDTIHFTEIMEEQEEHPDILDAYRACDSSKDCKGIAEKEDTGMFLLTKGDRPALIEKAEKIKKYYVNCELDDVTKDICTRLDIFDATLSAERDHLQTVDDNYVLYLAVIRELELYPDEISRIEDDNFKVVELFNTSTEIYEKTKKGITKDMKLIETFMEDTKGVREPQFKQLIIDLDKVYETIVKQVETLLEAIYDNKSELIDEKIAEFDEIIKEITEMKEKVPTIYDKAEITVHIDGFEKYLNVKYVKIRNEIDEINNSLPEDKRNIEAYSTMDTYKQQLEEIITLLKEQNDKISNLEGEIEDINTKLFANNDALKELRAKYDAQIETRDGNKSTEYRTFIKEKDADVISTYDALDKRISSIPSSFITTQPEKISVGKKSIQEISTGTLTEEQIDINITELLRLISVMETQINTYSPQIENMKSLNDLNNHTSKYNEIKPILENIVKNELVKAEELLDGVKIPQPKLLNEREKVTELKKTLETLLLELNNQHENMVGAFNKLDELQNRFNENTSQYEIVKSKYASQVETRDGEKSSELQGEITSLGNTVTGEYDGIIDGLGDIPSEFISEDSSLKTIKNKKSQIKTILENTTNEKNIDVNTTIVSNVIAELKEIIQINSPKVDSFEKLTDLNSYESIFTEITNSLNEAITNKLPIGNESLSKIPESKLLAGDNNEKTQLESITSTLNDLQTRTNSRNDIIRNANEEINALIEEKNAANSILEEIKSSHNNASVKRFNPIKNATDELKNSYKELLGKFDSESIRQFVVPAIKTEINEKILEIDTFIIDVRDETYSLMIDSIIKTQDTEIESLKTDVDSLKQITNKNEYDTTKTNIQNSLEKSKEILQKAKELIINLKNDNQTVYSNRISETISKIDEIEIRNYDDIITDIRKSLDNSTNNYKNGVLGIIHMSHQNGAKNNPRADYENKYQLLSYLNFSDQFVLQKSQITAANYNSKLLSSRNSPHLYVILSGYLKLPDNFNTIQFKADSSSGMYMRLNNKIIIKNNYLNHPWLRNYANGPTSETFNIVDIKDKLGISSTVIPYEIHIMKPHNKFILSWNIDGSGYVTIPSQAYYHNKSENEIYIHKTETLKKEIISGRTIRTGTSIPLNSSKNKKIKSVRIFDGEHFYGSSYYNSTMASQVFLKNSSNNKRIFNCHLQSTSNYLRRPRFSNGFTKGSCFPNGATLKPGTSDKYEYKIPNKKLKYDMFIDNFEENGNEHNYYNEIQFVMYWNPVIKFSKIEVEYYE